MLSWFSFGAKIIVFRSCAKGVDQMVHVIPNKTFNRFVRIVSLLKGRRRKTFTAFN